MEILLRHSVQWLHMKTSPAVQTHGVLDKEQDFLADMKALNVAEQRAVLSVHLLCLVMDGSMSSKEHELWKRVCNSVEDETVAFYMADRAGYLGTRFRNFVPLTAKMIRDCFDKCV